MASTEGFEQAKKRILVDQLAQKIFQEIRLSPSASLESVIGEMVKGFRSLHATPPNDELAQIPQSVAELSQRYRETTGIPRPKLAQNLMEESSMPLKSQGGSRQPPNQSPAQCFQFQGRLGNRSRINEVPIQSTNSSQVSEVPIQIRNSAQVKEVPIQIRNSALVKEVPIQTRNSSHVTEVPIQLRSTQRLKSDPKELKSTPEMNGDHDARAGSSPLKSSIEFDGAPNLLRRHLEPKAVSNIVGNTVIDDKAPIMIRIQPFLNPSPKGTQHIGVPIETGNTLRASGVPMRNKPISVRPGPPQPEGPFQMWTHGFNEEPTQMRGNPRIGEAVTVQRGNNLEAQLVDPNCFRSPPWEREIPIQLSNESYQDPIHMRKTSQQCMVDPIPLKGQPRKFINERDPMAVPIRPPQPTLFQLPSEPKHGMLGFFDEPMHGEKPWLDCLPPKTEMIHQELALEPKKDDPELRQVPSLVNRTSEQQIAPIQLRDKPEWHTPGEPENNMTTTRPTAEGQFGSAPVRGRLPFRTRRDQGPWVEMEPVSSGVFLSRSPSLRRSSSSAQVTNWKPPLATGTNSLPRPPRGPLSGSNHSVPQFSLRRSQSSQKLTPRPDDSWLRPRGSHRSSSMEHLHRVSIGSASDGILHVGDKIVQIDHHDATKLTHIDAQNIIKRTGTHINLGISRPGFSGPSASYPGLPAGVTSLPVSSSKMQHPSGHPASYGTPPAQSGGYFQPQPQIHQSMGGPRPDPYSAKQRANASQTVLDTVVSLQGRQSRGPAFSYGGPGPQSYSDLYYQPTHNHVHPQPVRPIQPTLHSPYSTFGSAPLANSCPAPFNVQYTQTQKAPHSNNSTSYFQRPPTPKRHIMPKIPNTYSAPQGKTIEVGGVKKQVVTKQFNSPLNLYSDEAIAEASITNPPIGASGGHPGFVPSQRHLPSPKDKIISRPQQSETFKLILESEMDGARNQQGVVGREFHQPAHSSRPSSSMSNRSQPDAIMMDNTIHQSASFKRLMYNMAAGAPEGDDEQTDF